MADNTEDEHLDNPTNIQSENPPVEITPTADTETINPNQETENMEVHHHAHNPAEPHHKKNWKSYFWEFLMLFLAVFCGFLAEYKLEHVIEDQREVKNIRSLIQDLESDTSNLQSYVDLRMEKKVMLDSLVTLLSSNSYKQAGSQTYFFARHIFTGYSFQSTDGSIQQLKNGGNLRLIKKENIVNSILAYDTEVKSLHEWDEADLSIRNSFREIGGSIFKADIFYHTMDTKMQFIRPEGNPQLITVDPSAINKVAFQVQYLTLMTQGNIYRGEKLKSQAVNLISLLKKEYHIE
jgi:hypothetical protein